MATFDIDLATFAKISAVVGGANSLVLITPDGNTWTAMITSTGGVAPGQQAGTGTSPDDALSALYSQLLSVALSAASDAQNQLAAAQVVAQTKIATANSISAAIPAPS